MLSITKTASLKFDFTSILFHIYMSQKANKDSKWEGKSSIEVKSVSAEQIWGLLEDFCSFHKWVPGLDSEKCGYVEGAYGEPGLIRLSVFTQQSSSTLANNDTDTKWCNEKLLSMDRTQRTLSYKITENNLGFRSYVGNMKVMDIDGGCKIEWWFVADPVEGIMRLEDLRGFLESNVKALAEGMRNLVIQPAH
ncbi:hypothetical protein QVD17_14651 [Tagetes erecta]|uniref:Lachrymatory factor synthase n=1 Tax=Tagetes erecta TaxID=13708 RepID=A0AAD8KMV3_TARER|nr:hypothetical protein QVD17_14651 [Tagetes erecta]